MCVIAESSINFALISDFFFIFTKREVQSNPNPAKIEFAPFLFLGDMQSRHAEPGRLINGKK
jgi:hypothetical protein